MIKLKNTSVGPDGMPSRFAKKFLYKALENNEQFDNQYAFRPKGSTTAALVALTQEITTALEYNNYIQVLSLDFSKAFDAIRHVNLLEQLSRLNLSTEVFNWMVDFVTERHHVHF